MSARIRQLVEQSYSPNWDNFGRLRVGTPKWLGKSKQLIDPASGASVNPCVWSDEATGAGTATTYNANQASSTLSVSANTVGTRVHQTLRHYNYQPGSSHWPACTFVLGPLTTGVIKRVGYFTAASGLFLEQNGVTGKTYIVRRTSTTGSPVDEKIEQARWDIDTLNSGGLSSIKLDENTEQLLITDFGWFGAGTARVGFHINGVLYWATRFEAGNLLSTVYLSQPNLPMRYEISSSGTNSAGSLVRLCTAVATEAGDDELGYTRSADRGTDPLTLPGTTLWRPIVCIRLRSAYPFVTIKPRFISLETANQSVLNWRLIVNPVFTGTAPVWQNVVNSAVECAVTTTNATSVDVGTAGTNTYIGPAGYYRTGSQNRVELGVDEALGSTISGTSDIHCLAVKAVTNDSIFGAITWLEQQ